MHDKPWWMYYIGQLQHVKAGFRGLHRDNGVRRLPIPPINRYLIA
jgi:hypothetical protein